MAEAQLQRERAEADIALMQLKITKEAELKAATALMQPQKEEGEAHEKAEMQQRPRKVTIQAPSGQTYTGVIE